MINFPIDASMLLLVVCAFWSIIVYISGLRLRGCGKELARREKNLNEYEAYLERKENKLDARKEALDNKELRLNFLK